MADHAVKDSSVEVREILVMEVVAEMRLFLIREGHFAVKGDEIKKLLSLSVWIQIDPRYLIRYMKDSILVLEDIIEAWGRGVEMPRRIS